MGLLGPEVAFQDRLGAYFWSSKFDLGASSGLLVAFNPFFDRFWLPKGSPKTDILAAKVEPKPIQKRFKIEVDFQERKHTLQARFGNVLEPSWADLGPS